MRVPKYYRIKGDLLRLIGGATPGTGLPTERELAERFQTSRTTVRQALAELAIEGRLERAQGRGTYVAEPKLIQLRQLSSFSEDVRRRGGDAAAVVLSITRTAADAEVARALGLDVGRLVYRVERVRQAGDEPIAIEVAHLRGAFPRLRVELGRRGSLYATLAEAYGIDLAAAEDAIETTMATPEQAELLGADTGLPMLLICRTAWDRDGAPVEYTRALYRGDRFRFVARFDATT